MVELASIRIVRRFVEELGGTVIATHIGKHAKIHVLTPAGVQIVIAPLSPSDHRWALQARAYVRRLFPRPEPTVPPPKRRSCKKRYKTKVGKPFRPSSTYHNELADKSHPSWQDVLAHLRSEMHPEAKLATPPSGTLRLPLKAPWLGQRTRFMEVPVNTIAAVTE